jgi:hypothetical protein
MLQYHGTNRIAGQAITNNQIDVAIGGGELGRGFYTGDLKHEAFTWAHQIYGAANKSVVEIDIIDDEFFHIDPLCLNYREALNYRRIIRDRQESRTFLFDSNAVWSPVVGKYIPNFNQIKWESEQSENFLNSIQVTKFLY